MIAKNFLAVNLLFLSLGTWAQSGPTSWGDSQSDGVRESATTSVYSPGRQAFDGSINTAWQLVPGSTSGWIERYWPTNQRLEGATINLDLVQGASLQLSLLEQNHWVPIPGAEIMGPVRGSVTLTFPGGLPPTSKVLLSVQGNGADQTKVWDVAWKQNVYPVPYKKILPQSYSFNQGEFINLKPSRLWDGILGNQWFDPLWSFPWEVFQTDDADKPTSIFPPYYGNPPKDAEIIWQLDGTYQIDTLKANFLQGYQQVEFQFWDGAKWSNPQILGTNVWNAGWQRLDLSTSVKTNKIRITFPGGWDRARYFGELEVWGDGWADQGSSLSLPIGSPSTSDGSYHFTVNSSMALDYRLDVTVQGASAANLSGTWNGNSFSVAPTTWIGSQTIYNVSLAKESLKPDNQFLKLLNPGTLSSVVLTPNPDNGQLSLGFPYTDGQFEATSAGPNVPVPSSKAQQWDLGNTYQLEKLRVYRPNPGNPVFQTGLGKTWTNVVWTNLGQGWWEASLKGILADHLAFTSDVAVTIDEIQLYGTVVYDSKVGMEIWYPPRNSSVTASSISDTNSIIGWMGDPSVSPLVGGFNPRQADKLFWMPMNQMTGAFDQGQSVTYSGILGKASATGMYPITWWAQHDSSTLIQGPGYVSTTNASFTLSGTVSKSSNRVFINGAEAPVVGTSFSWVAPLQEGFQQLVVQVWDKNKKKLQAQWIKPVYRTVGNPVLQLDLPAGDLWTQLPSLLVTGRVGNGTGLTLTLNGKAVPLTGNSFSQTLPLSSSTSTWAFILSDDAGRSTKQSLTVNQSSTAPVISVQTPTVNQYLASSLVALNIQGPSVPLWWKFNQEPWEPASGYLESKSYTLADGFYTYSITAQDRMGNLSQTVQLPFCVDTVPPHPFTVTANISGWSSNNTPVISFSTVDDTSGVDHYEVQIDNGSSTTQTSPYQLPTLSDGVHTVFVRAYDRSGNPTVETITLSIDTSAPYPPTNFDVVPGATEVDLKWLYGTDDGENFRTFRVERSPAWPDGAHVTDGLSHVDASLKTGDVYQYRIWSVDRAGNTSSVSDWKSVKVGLTQVPVSTTSPTPVEYKTATVTVTPQALPTNVTQVTINELPVTALQSGLPVNPTVSQIIQFMVTRTDTLGTTTTTDHADLAAPVPVQLTYDPTKVPQGYSEAQLKPFYYDSVWGRWIPVSGAFVDTSNHTVNFQTNHFTDFTVQATQAVDESPQQLRDVQFSPFGTQTTHGPLTVSPQGGSVSTEFTELVLPGKNGLDLVLKRTYDTGTAQSDASSGMDASSNGEYPWTLGAGWRLNFPSMKWNGDGLWVKDLDGRVVSFGQMGVVNNYSSGGNQIVVLSNHESSDETVELTFSSDTHYSYFLWWQTGSSTTYKYLSTKLTTKDGREVDFDGQGRVVTILDGTRLNHISFNYNGNQADFIKDSMGRVLSFDYAGGRISSISVKTKDDSYPTSITYTSPNGTLDSATDVGGREWKYKYLPQDIYSSTHLTNPPTGYQDSSPTKSTVQALSSMSGVGIGTSTMAYQIQSFNYNDSTGGYTFQVNYQQVQAQSLTVGLDTSHPLRTTQYQFSSANAGGSQFYTSQSVVDDSRLVTTTTYTPVSKGRNSLSNAPDALKGAWSFGTRPASNEVVTYPGTMRTAQEDGTVLETQTQTWDTGPMRLTDSKQIRSLGVTKETSYQYDGWGNVTNLTESSIVGSWRTQKVTKASYYNAADQDVTLGQSFWPFSNADRGFTNGQHNLTAATIVQSSGSVPGTTAPQSTIQTQFFDYTDLGQLATKEQLAPGGQLSVTSYLYDPGTGQVSQVTFPAPLNQVTAYTYDYETVPRFYLVTTTRKAVQLGTSAPDVVTKAGFRTLNGTLSWTQDANGFSTLKEYDALGRVTRVIEPSDSDAKAISMPTQPFKAGDANPVTVVTYSDVVTAPSSMVTNPLGGKTVYQFDALGRLTNLTKINTFTPGTTISGWPVSETIQTQLVYDNYDQVKEVDGPWSDSEKDKTRSLTSLATTFTYDSRGRVLTVHSPGATGSKGSVYADAQNQVSNTDELGNLSQDTLDWNGQVLSHKNFVNHQWIETQNYPDADGRPLAQKDANGNIITYKYNELGLVSEIDQPARPVFENGVSATVVPKTIKNYFPDGTLQSVVQGVRETDYTYNGLGKVLTSTSPVTTAVGKTQVVVSNVYDPNGNLESQSSGYASDGITHSKAWFYDSHSRVHIQTDELNHSVTYTHDKAGNRISVTDPRQGLSSYQGNFSLALDYDQFNRLVHATLPQSAGQSSTPQMFLAYDGRGNLVQRQEADGQTTLYQYSLRNLLKAQTLTTQAQDTKYITQFGYDDAGRQTTVTSPSHRIITTNYDEMGRVLSQGNDSSGWTSFTYDGNGNKRTVTDGRQNQTGYTYDPDNQVLTQTDAKTNVSSIAYNRWGQKSQTVDAEQNSRAYSYDELGRLTGESTPWGASPSYSYDAWGNQTSFTDARGTVFTRKFYPDNRIQNESATNSALGTSQLWSYLYDEGGDLQSANADGVVTIYNTTAQGYQPDPFGLKTSVTETFAGTTLSMGYSYDNRQRLTGASYPGQTSSSYSYNQVGQLDTMPGWISGNLSYDSYGRLQTYSLVDQVAKTLSYDSDDRLKSLDYKTSNGLELKAYSFTYDKASNIVTKNGNSYVYDELNRLYTSTEQGWFLKTPEDLAGKVSYGVSDQDYQASNPVSFSVAPTTVVKLDYASRSLTVNLGTVMGVNKIVLQPQRGLHRVRERDLAIYSSSDNATYTLVTGWVFNQNSDGSLVLQFPEIFSAQFVKVTTIWDDRDITNSPIDKATFLNTTAQLVQVWALSPSQVQDYRYDKAGNRASLTLDGMLATSRYYKNSAGGDLPWLATDGIWFYQYDPNGNVITKAKQATVDYNSRSFIIDANQEYWTYSWTLRNLLSSVSHNGTQVVSYLYDATNLRVERTSPTDTTVYASGRNGAIAYKKSLTTGVARTYAYLNDQTIGWTDTAANGTKSQFFTTTDNLGSVTQIADANAKVVWSSEYTPFGKTAGIEGLYSFDGSYAGHEVDADTGLVYMWNRWQDPETGRFISEDPARAGTNFYVYANNSPLVFADPTGLDPGGMSLQQERAGVMTQAALRDNGWKQVGNTGIYGGGYVDSQYKSQIVVSGNTATWYNSSGGVQAQAVSNPTLTQIGVGVSGSNAGMNWGLSGGLAAYTPAFSDQAQFSLFATVSVGQSTGFGGSVSAFLAGTANPTGLSDINGGGFGLGGSAADILSGGYEHDWSSSGTSEQFSLGLGFGLEEHSTFNYTWSLPLTTDLSPSTTTTTTTATSDSSSSSGTKSGGGSIICTELHRQGLMDDATYRIDEDFGRALESKAPFVLVGYRFLARPIVLEMQESRSFTLVVFAATKPWVNEMAHIMGSHHQVDIVGLLIMLIGIPLAALVGIFIMYPIPLIGVLFVLIAWKTRLKRQPINQQVSPL
jgi:RHS repeat-associated protein